MYTILNINQSNICHLTIPSIWTSEYHNYCVRLLVIALQRIQKPINIILGDINYNFNNINKTIKIDIQSEHTLVKLGGRSVDEIIYGNIDTLDGNGKYLIRIPNYKYYSQLDATIEYSLPNLINLKTNDRFANYLKKAIYIAPVIYDCSDFDSINRVETITLGNNSERRIDFARKTEVLNVQNVLSKEHLKQIYKKTKIMVNIHQTDHHHTLEELRVLPALCNGVVIISEDVPLKETVPYADSIIWSSYDNLVQTVQSVQHNYDYFFKKIFTSKLEEQIIKFHQNNIENCLTFLEKLT